MTERLPLNSSSSVASDYEDLPRYGLFKFNNNLIADQPLTLVIIYV
jgi:hypothetical protein